MRKMLAGTVIVIAGLFLLSAPNVLAQGEPCTADFDCNGNVDAEDVTIFLSMFGRNPFNNPCPDCYNSPCPCTICPYGMVDCGDKCVDPMTDREYCGATEGCFDGITCVDGEICSDGICTLSCQSGLTNCSGICVNTEIDEAFCGSCTNSCESGELCITGVCYIPSLTCNGTLSPIGRWCDQEDGTVKDMISGLVWLKKADWGEQYQFWVSAQDGINAHDRAAQLWDGSPSEGNADLSDGSDLGDWRTPTLTELEGITVGDEYISSSQMYFFTGVQADSYWSSTAHSNLLYAYYVYMDTGFTAASSKQGFHSVWPVRDGH